MLKILFAGEGGQGVQVAAQILAQAAFKEGKKVSYIPNFGVEQRGGFSLAFLIIDERPIAYPKFAIADIAAVFSKDSLKRVKEHLGKKTKIILGPGVKEKTELTPRVWNTAILGKVNRAGGIVKEESLIAAMDERWQKQFEKNSDLRKLNLEALNDKRF